MKDTENVQESEKAGGRARRPYDRPAVSWEEDFQPYVFSTCGKMAGQGVACNFMQKS